VYHLRCQRNNGNAVVACWHCAAALHLPWMMYNAAAFVLHGSEVIQVSGEHLSQCLLCALQVVLSHRLGLANVFDSVRPSLHYKLRMWRADEHQVSSSTRQQPLQY
jgi:hypothetical protein